MHSETEIEYIATGNELLDGSTTDRHTQSLAQAIRPFGFRIRRTTVVSDSRSDLKLALTEAGIRSKIVVVTGGLGPTSDDLTLEVAASAFGSKLVFSKVVEKSIKARLKAFRGRRLNDGHKKQMYIPDGAKILSNSVGTAPGLEWLNGDRVLFFLPGVPSEFNAILREHLVPWFEARRSEVAKHLFIYKVFGWPESGLNELMKSFKCPKQVELGYRTTLPENHIKLLVDAKSSAEAKRIIQPILKKMRARLGSALFAENTEMSFEECILTRLKKAKRKVAIAESCTGGLASSLLTSVSGSSEVLDRSFITYSNEAKQDMLQVSAKTLKAHGAVSKEVALEMARGALKNSLAQRAVAITGIAGPSGGSKEKPVGTIWFAVVDKKAKLEKAEELNLGFSRVLNQKYSAYKALDLLANA